MDLTDKRWKILLLLALSGVLTGLTLIFTKIGFVQWVTLVPVGIFLLREADSDSHKYKGLYGYGFFFFMCYYVVTYHWFVNLYPLEFIDGMTPLAAVVVVLAGCVGLSALQAFFGGFLFVAVRLLLRTRALRRYSVLRPFAIGGAWAIFEWSQNFGWWGVPWGRLPIAHSEYIVGLQTASLFGSYFVTFIIVSVNMCVAFALVRIAAMKLMSICVTAMLLFQYAVGALIYFIPVDSENTVRVAAVQGNIDSGEKWGSSMGARTLSVYYEYTLKAAEAGADIVVWPETALPYKVEKNNVYGQYCSELARAAGVTILVGGFTDGGNYNSIICVLPDGSFHQTVYSKRRLVPFGEFVPMSALIETLIPPLAELVMSSGSVEWGEGSQIFELEEGRIGSLICFDSIYEELNLESVRDGAELICLSTYDSWFTDSAALYMHNAQAQLRAIETRRQIVRSANTGISTVITKRGEVIAELAPLVDGMLVEDVELHTQTTLYTRIGNLFVYLWILILLLLLGGGTVFSVQTRMKKIRSTKKS